MRQSFTAEQWLPYSIEPVFAFFANPANLPRLMPPAQQPRIEESNIVPPPSPSSQTPSTSTAGPGSRITLSFRPIAHLPFRTSWQAEISSFLWNDHFCDTQLHGPFAFWRHCHHFTTETRALTPGTLLRDIVEYEPPVGPLGTLANQLFIKRMLERSFAYRHQRTFELLSHLSPTLDL